MFWRTRVDKIRFDRRILIRPERRAAVAQAIGKWGFSAHDFSEDELLHAASLMIQHALTLPDLEQWRITAGESDDCLRRLM